MKGCEDVIVEEREMKQQPTVKELLDSETLSEIELILKQATAKARKIKDVERRKKINSAIEKLRSARRNHSLSRFKRAIDTIGNLFA